MPIYEYYCQHCAARFEALRTMSQADTAIKCPQCEVLTQQRMISRFAAHASSGGSTHAVAGGGGCGSCSGGNCGGCKH